MSALLSAERYYNSRAATKSGSCRNELHRLWREVVRCMCQTDHAHGEYGEQRTEYRVQYSVRSYHCYPCRLYPIVSPVMQVGNRISNSSLLGLKTWGGDRRTFSSRARVILQLRLVAAQDGAVLAILEYRKYL